MKKLLVNIFLVFLIFDNIILTQFNLPEIFGYWDEAVEMCVLIIGIIGCSPKVQKGTSKKYIENYFLILCIVIIGIFGNLIFNYVHSFKNIIKDIASFLKFPLILIIMYDFKINDSLTKNISKYFFVFLKFMICLMTFCGVISLFKDIGMSQNTIRYGIKPYQFLYSHPTYLVLSSVLILAFISSQNLKKSNNMHLYEIMLLLNIILSMRTKGIIIVALYFFVKYFVNFIKKFKVMSTILILIIIIIFGYSKFEMYASYKTSAREVLYFGSLDLVKECFPIGSGFSTYASHISGQANSEVYHFIRIPYYYTESNIEQYVLGDAGYPYYIGQFGILGCIILIRLSFNILKKATDNMENSLPVLLILLYILVALTSESLLVNNGVELAIILSCVSSLNKKKEERI